MPNKQVKSFRLDGFSLGKDKPFGDTDTLARVHFCILGPSNVRASQEEKRITVENALAKLFDVLVNSRTLFTTLRDNEIFWTAIGAQWASFRPLSSQDIKKIVELYSDGRQKFLSDRNNHKSDLNKKTPLKEAVDHWFKLRDEVMALPPTARVAKLTLNPNRSQVDRLADTLDNFSIDRDSTWLPAHITVQEYLWICEGHVEDQLQSNLTINGRLKLPFRPRTAEDIPTLPHNLSHPTDTRIFLCFTGLTRFNPANSKFAVFMQPIGFFHGSDRKDWYLATGSLSTKHAIFTEYYKHAVRMITKHGRDRVFGVVTYWMDRPETFVEHYERDKTERQTRSMYWNDNCMRYGLGLCVAKMPRGSYGYRITMYDMDYPNLVKHPKVPKTGDEKVDETIVCLREWRDVASTAADFVFKDTLQEWWQGGNRPQRLTRDYQITYPRHDPVSHSCAWLWDMVNGFGPGVDALDREMAQWGYEKLPMTEWNPSGSDSDGDSSSEEEEAAPKRAKTKPQSKSQAKTRLLLNPRPQPKSQPKPKGKGKGKGKQGAKKGKGKYKNKGKDKTPVEPKSSSSENAEETEENSGGSSGGSSSYDNDRESDEDYNADDDD
ncbi:hypothetical protein KJ359_007278 [Pestalotiopsis sp. 9143b]|nr:hypothetical protein KJ359_007278 [Pestalotiopsis sp. 9143b]